MGDEVEISDWFRKSGGGIVIALYGQDAAASTAFGYAENNRIRQVAQGNQQIYGFIRDAVPDKFVVGDDEEIHGRRVTGHRCDLGFKTGGRIGVRFPMSIPSQRDAGPDLNTGTLTQIARINANLGGDLNRKELRDQHDAGPDWGSQVKKLVAMTRYYFPLLPITGFGRDEIADAATGINHVAGVAWDDVEMNLRHSLAGCGAVIEAEVKRFR